MNLYCGGNENGKPAAGKGKREIVRGNRPLIDVHPISLDIHTARTHARHETRSWLSSAHKPPISFAFGFVVKVSSNYANRHFQCELLPIYCIGQHDSVTASGFL